MEGERLTDEETALVLRRAVELHHQVDPDPGGLDAAALEDVAVEAGLSREAVRRALAELRLGALAPAPAGRPPCADRLFGPATVVVSRVVAGAADAVEPSVREWLESQLFRVVRDTGDRSVWTPRNDLKASVQRHTDRRVQRRLVLGDVARIHLAVAAEPGPAGGGALVHLELDVPEVRRAAVGWLATGGVVGVAALVGTAMLSGLEPVTAAAVPAGAAAVLAGHRVGASQYRHRAAAVDTAVQGMLDGLERRALTPLDERRRSLLARRSGRRP